jgi:ankyrin repeat protein
MHHPLLHPVFLVCISNRRGNRFFIENALRSTTTENGCTMKQTSIACLHRAPVFGLALGLALAVPLASKGQVPPSAAEVASYGGLHAAAHRGDLAQLIELLAAKAHVDARDSYGRTPLHVATFARQREAIRLLAKAGANLALLEGDRYDAVTIAAVADDEETLRVLLALGASAKLITSRYDGTALIAAAHLGHDGVVRQLIAAGAPLDHVNNLHWTALIEAIVLGNGGRRHVETVRALVAAGASTRLADRNGQTPLMLARKRGYAGMVRILEKAGAR